MGCLSWIDARAYARWLSVQTGERYRLPSEAEWEYVARAGATTRYFWGDDAEPICNFSNSYDLSGRRASAFAYEWAECDDGYTHVAPVGSFRPNPFGLFDVLGNVWEWTEDCYTLNYPAEPVDGSDYQSEGECELRSVRGGSWITRPERHRVSFRGRDPADNVFAPFGFRLARDIQ